MYKRIEAHLILTGMTKREMAQCLGISYNTLLLKLKGMSSFTLDEAIEIRRILQATESVEELFIKMA